MFKLYIYININYYESNTNVINSYFLIVYKNNNNPNLKKL